VRVWFLRVFVDNECGVTLDDCADVCREISAQLDVEDVIQTAYRLEVSSPGLDRPLKKHQDYQRFQGRLAKIKMLEKLDPDGRGHERKTFIGKLMGLEGEVVKLMQTDRKGGVIDLPLADIEKAHLEFED
jgi:ribosome maturation factor RimP